MKVETLEATYTMPLEDGYTRHAATPSDIHEHLGTLRFYASKCSRVVECGVRNVVSSYAFACGLKGKEGASLILVDPYKSQNIEPFLTECTREEIDARFVNESDLTCPTFETDLLFIDTWHIYGQLKRELERWNSSVSKYIILHDTTVDEWQGETVRCGWNAREQSLASGIPEHEILCGLWPAIDEFLQSHSEWRLEKRYTNNNGLTILARQTQESDA